MNRNFISALQKATHLVRGQNLTEATRLIQNALAGGTGPADSRDQPDDLKLACLNGPDEGMAGFAATAPKFANFIKTRGFPAFPGGLNSAIDPAPPLPDGASFQARSFTCPAGTRGYKLYIPAGAPDGVRGLVIMLHGCKQHPDDFAAGTNMNAVAQANQLVVVYPGQTSAANATSCWNWFNPADQVRDSGEPAIIAGLARAIMLEFAIAADRVFVAGLSAGGAMAAILGETYPDLFSAVGVHSGLPCGSAHDVVSAFSVMQGAPPVGAGKRRGAEKSNARSIRTIVFHGSADRVVYPANADRIVSAASPSGLSKSAAQVGHGHENGRNYSRTVLKCANGRQVVENWLIDGAGHAWSGGKPGGSFTDQRGPDASAQMVRFFLEGPFLDTGADL